MNSTAPLHHLRVLELSGGKTDMCARLLADLGADVVLVEPATGSPARQRGPHHAGHSLYFAAHNANKRSVKMDLENAAERTRFTELAARADVLVNSLGPATLTGLGLSLEALTAEAPGLIVLSISDFGLSGPYSDYRASNAVHMALGGVLARSGIKGRDPLLPPGEMAEEA
ncbi:MAG: CoA transferase, partial [Parahaliea sp.]